MGLLATTHISSKPLFSLLPLLYSRRSLFSSTATLLRDSMLSTPQGPSFPTLSISSPGPILYIGCYHFTTVVSTFYLFIPAVPCWSWYWTRWVRYQTGVLWLDLRMQVRPSSLILTGHPLSYFMFHLLLKRFLYAFCLFQLLSYAHLCWSLPFQHQSYVRGKRTKELCSWFRFN